MKLMMAWAVLSIGAIICEPGFASVANISVVGNKVDLKILSGSQTKVAIDGVGNAYAVWHDITTSKIMGSIRTRDGWSQPFVVSLDDLAPSAPVIAVSAKGNGIVAWKTKKDIRARLITKGDLEPKINTLSHGGAVSAPTCARNNSGKAVVVWNNSTKGIMGAVYDGTAWEPEAQVSPVAASKNEYSGARLGMDEEGNAVTIYENASNIDHKGISASRYIVGSGWVPEQLSDPELPGEINERSLAVNGKGEAVAVWRLQNNLTYHLYYAVLPSITQGNWTAPRTISLTTAGYGSLDANAAINDAGYAEIIWDRGQSQKGIYAIHKLPGETQFEMKSETVQSCTKGITPRINLDNFGNALASWYDINFRGVYISRKLGMKGDWSEPQLVSHDYQPYAQYPQNAVNPSGRAAIIWSNQIKENKMQNVIQSAKPIRIK